VFNGVMTLDQVEAMLLETAVDKARGNLSSAARMLGLTRPQLAYRLKRLHDGDEARADAGPGGSAPSASAPATASAPTPVATAPAAPEAHFGPERTTLASR
jgi:hypothetical protein